MKCVGNSLKLNSLAYVKVMVKGWLPFEKPWDSGLLSAAL